MVNALILIETFFLVIIASFLLSFVISSIREKEGRAACIGGLIFSALLGVIIGIFSLQIRGFFQTTLGLLLLLAGFVMTAGVLVLLIRRSGQNPRALEGAKGYIVGEVKRFDEREQVFARNRSLPPDTEQYQTFYLEHPQWEAYDGERRKRGGPLGIPGTIDKPYERPNVAALMASFSIPYALGNSNAIRPKAPPSFQKERISLSPEEAAVRIKGLAHHIGADMVGIAEINPLWIYSKRGEIFYDNWDQWGEEIELDHRYAIVFAMEMAREMVWAAPHSTSVVESGIVYAKGAFIATQMASFIANLGYLASANHLRHYDLLLVPLAVDAGLGEVGRFGYLITKKFGPRVRLGCVTTDLPLIPDRPVDIGVEDFCRLCKKCARCCPSKSIPFDDLREGNGTLRWKLNAETCFDYWGKVGTDCNICMRVCPWSHPRTLPHRLIIELVIRNRIARSIFSPMDDIFYGIRPRPYSLTKWATYE